MDGPQTKHHNDSQTQISPFCHLCYLCAIAMNVLLCVCFSICVHLSGTCLSPPATVCVSASHSGPPVGILGVSLVCLHGVWCLCSNGQQVCSIVSVCIHCIDREKSAQPYTAVCTCANWCVSACQPKSYPPPLFPPFPHQRRVITACKADAVSDAVLATYSSLPQDQKILHQNQIPKYGL